MNYYILIDLIQNDISRTWMQKIKVYNTCLLQIPQHLRNFTLRSIIVLHCETRQIRNNVTSPEQNDKILQMDCTRRHIFSRIWHSFIWQSSTYQDPFDWSTSIWRKWENYHSRSHSRVSCIGSLVYLAPTYIYSYCGDFPIVNMVICAVFGFFKRADRSKEKSQKFSKNTHALEQRQMQY